MSARRGRGPAAALIRALTANAAGLDVVLAATDVAARPWFSATFAGERCRVTLKASGDRLSEWLAVLPEADLPVRGHYVADLTVLSAVDGEVRLEALVLEGS